MKTFYLRLKGNKYWHIVKADNLSQAKFKFLKGTKNVNERDIEVKKKAKRKKKSFLQKLFS